MDDATLAYPAAFDDRLPWLSGRRTPEEDRAYFREQVFPVCEVWSAFGGGSMRGIIAFRSGSIDQLYVLPKDQGQGIGTALLGVVQTAFPHLRLWTFQRNLPARRFYDARGLFWLGKPTARRTRRKSRPRSIPGRARSTADQPIEIARRPERATAVFFGI